MQFDEGKGFISIFLTHDSLKSEHSLWYKLPSDPQIEDEVWFKMKEVDDIPAIEVTVAIVVEVEMVVVVMVVGVIIVSPLWLLW